MEFSFCNHPAGFRSVPVLGALVPDDDRCLIGFRHRPLDSWPGIALFVLNEEQHYRGVLGARIEKRGQESNMKRLKCETLITNSASTYAL